METKDVRIIFMGTPAFAVPTLASLINNNYEVVAVYTQPPRPSGRHYHVQKSPVHELALEHSLPVYHPVSLKNEQDQHIFKTHQADLAIVVAYGLILPKKILEAPTSGCLNIHGSLLPRWRGAAPIQRAIEAGDTSTGVCIMQMDVGLDTGPVIATSVIDIGPDDTSQSLHERLSTIGAKLMVDTLPDYLSGQLQGTSQPLEGITYAAKIEKEEGHLDWHQSATTLYNKWRAFNPWPGAFFLHKGVKLKVIQVHSVPNILRA